MLCFAGSLSSLAPLPCQEVHLETHTWLKWLKWAASNAVYGMCLAASEVGGSAGLSAWQHWNLSRSWLRREEDQEGSHPSWVWGGTLGKRNTWGNPEVRKERANTEAILSKWAWRVGRNTLQQVTLPGRPGGFGETAMSPVAVIFNTQLTRHTLQEFHTNSFPKHFFIVRYNILYFRYVCISSAACLELCSSFSPTHLSLFYVYLYSDSDCQRSWPSFSADQQSSSAPSSPGKTHNISLLHHLY